MFRAGGFPPPNYRADAVLTEGAVQELDILFQPDHSLQQMDHR
jgi:hypothetical protein